MKHILVAGGAGYIGAILVPQLIDRGYVVTVLDAFHFGNSLTNIQNHAGDRLKIFRADIRSCSYLVFEGVDGVIDLAGISNDPSCALDPSVTRSVNVDGGTRLITFARNAGVTRYIYSSSCSVYGDAQSGSLIEDDTPRPTSLYAHAKIEVEKYLMDAGKASDGVFEVVALRLATVFGLSPRMRFDLAVNVMTKNAINLNCINVDGGDQWRPFIHVQDAARGFINALEASGKTVSNQIFNLGANENNIQISNLASRIQRAVPKAEIRANPNSADIRNYNVDFSKAENILNFRNLKSIEYGIDEVRAALVEGKLEPEDRRWNTLKQYIFLRSTEQI